MAGRRRGARSGRGWDALPPRAERQQDPAPARRRAHRAAGSTVTQSQQEQPQAATRDPGEVAREICLRLLSARPRTRAELASALKRRGIADEVAAEVLDRYDEVGIIDDAAFARAWVSTRHHGKGLARRALAGELRRRGVDDDTVRDAVDELDGDTEAQTARALVERRLRGTTSGDPEAMLRKLVGMLARKGYPPGLAFRVVKDALAEHGGRAAEFADHLDADALAEAEESAEAASAEAANAEVGD